MDKVDKIDKVDKMAHLCSAKFAIAGQNYIKSIYFHYDEKIEHYGLKLLLEFDSNNYLLFDSTDFISLNNVEELKKRYNWKEVNYPELSTKDVYIKNIMEDELTSYFIEFSNDDILYVYQRIYGYGEWEQDFEIVGKDKSLIRYNEVKEYMNEDWIGAVYHRMPFD